MNGWMNKNDGITLARGLSWLGHRPVHRKATGMIPCQGTYLGCGFHPWSGRAQEATTERLMCLSHIDVSFCLSLPAIPSL